jgi:cytochrome c556
MAKLTISLFVFCMSAATALIAPFAVAHEGAMGIVKERMTLMSGLGDTMKVLSAIFKKERPYDAKAVAEAAQSIRDHSGEALTKLFPKGSLDHPSVAKQEIWQKWDDFKRMAEDLKIYADALAKAAPTGNADAMPHSGGANGMMSGMPHGGMMGQGITGQGIMTDEGQRPDATQLAGMPVQALFAHVAQTCSSCHTQFRSEKKH